MSGYGMPLTKPLYGDHWSVQLDYCTLFYFLVGVLGVSALMFSVMLL